MKKEDDVDDFGFTLEDSVEKLTEPVLQDIKHIANEALDELYGKFLPLLNNLEKDPTKPTINWPNRAEKIKEFKTKLEATKQELKRRISKA